MWWLCWPWFLYSIAQLPAFTEIIPVILSLGVRISDGCWCCINKARADTDGLDILNLMRMLIGQTLYDHYDGRFQIKMQECDVSVIFLFCCGFVLPYRVSVGIFATAGIITTINCAIYVNLDPRTPALPPRFSHPGYGPADPSLLYSCHLRHLNF